MTPTSIPSAVKARIEAEAIAETNWTKAEQAAFIIGMERMYCEIFKQPYIFGPERTKLLGLLEEEWRAVAGFVYPPSEVEEKWQEYKRENEI